MKKTLYLLLFTLLCSSSTTRPPLRTGKDLAVFFAVTSYQNGKLGNLQNPIKNAREIAATLRDRFGFNTQILENPTRKQIKDKIDELNRLYARNEDGKHPSDGQLLLYFSGHGMSEDENGYFLPADANPSRELRMKSGGPKSKISIAAIFWLPLMPVTACVLIPNGKTNPTGNSNAPAK